MRGTPDVLKTRADYERVRDLTINDSLPYADKIKAIKHWRALLGGRWRWEFDKELEFESEADSGDNYRVIKERDEETEEIQRIVQEKRVESLNARLFKLEFTVEEVQDVISSMEEVING